MIQFVYSHQSIISQSLLTVSVDVIDLFSFFYVCFSFLLARKMPLLRSASCVLNVTIRCICFSSTPQWVAIMFALFELYWEIRD